MDPARRQRMLQSLAEARARVSEAFEDYQQASRVLSQDWVDKRRLLFAEETLSLLQRTLEEDALEVRAFAEALAELLHRATELAPGHGLAGASRTILEALADGDPEAPEPH